MGSERAGSLGSFVADLGAAVTFEQAAELTLRRAVALVTEHLERAADVQGARVLRGMVHLRPGDGYRQLVVLEGGPAGSFRLDRSVAPLTSATAWRWVLEQRTALSVDMGLGGIRTYRRGATPLPEPAPAFRTDRSVASFVGRNATDVLVLPLRAPGGHGVFAGLVSLEANAAAARVPAALWDQVIEPISLLVDIAAPYFLALPLGPVSPPGPDDLLPVVGAKMAPLVEMLGVFAAQRETLLIGGATGTGKSRIARWCHARSPRRDGPFETVDLNTVPEELQQGELFGWRKGAFTGAVKDKDGALVRAERGTLFIDEIDKLSLKAQAALLQVLETRYYRPLGAGGEALRCDLRFLIGSNADLPRAVREGRFREDLFYRINVLPVRLPALRERPDEIPAWARYMAGRRHAEAQAREGGQDPAVTAILEPEAEQLLIGEPWPGNLRQLDNIVRRAFALALVDLGGDARGAIVVRAEHVRRGLAYDAGEHLEQGVMGALNAAAGAFVAAARRKLAAGGPPLDLDHADAFRGCVLRAAALRGEGGPPDEDREAAFLLLGRAALVTSRNHHKVFRRELERLAALGEAIGEPVTVVAEPSP
jgi:hypothetical protein